MESRPCACAVERYERTVSRNLNLLESVQRFAARLTTKQWQASTQNQLLHTLNWTPLCVRRKKQKAMVCRRILLGHSVIPSSYLTPTPRPNPRTNHLIPLLTPFARTTLYQSSFFVSCVPIWNHLPESVISAPSSHSKSDSKLVPFSKCMLHSPVSSSCLCFLHLCFFVSYLTCPNCILSI